MQDNIDVVVIRDAQSGNTEAFRSIYDWYKVAVHGYCLRLLGNSADAEDAAQESFVRAYQHLPSLDHPASFRYWLFTIVRNEVFGRIRRRSAHRQVTLDEVADSVWVDDTPFDSTVRADLAGQVRTLLDALKPEYREALVLREVEGMSYVEIAAVTGDSEGAIKARLFKARKALARKLEASFPETGSL